MPELPDVEVFRRYINRTSIKKKIKKVYSRSGRVVKASKKDLKKLEGKKIKGTSRHGKYLFLEMAGRKIIVLHFGMTGDIEYYKTEEKEKPEYSHLVLDFSEGHSLAYINKRKLGKVLLTDDLKGFVKEHDLGPDAMPLTKKQFRSTINDSGGMIKTMLMDQSRMAGIGNIYSDEILYQAGVHPEKKASKLKDKDIDSIHSAMKRVLKTAIRHKAQPDDFPRSYLLKNRKQGADCGKCKGKIRKKIIGGRSGYFCPKHQK
ncbi:DNA-formamidopyrimidine glycosylase [Candidatus Woesearchaeota archaeon]|nr:DNA-formamidopyrimidine glycosylase [Candidatus Woesearchaeota archaeon]